MNPVLASWLLVIAYGVALAALVAYTLAAGSWFGVLALTLVCLGFIVARRKWV